MKVGGIGPANGGAPVGAGASRAAPAAGGFAPQDVTSARAASASGGASAVSGLEALLALQDVGGPRERRRRMIVRGGRLLDGLDRVRLAILEGGDVASELGELRRGVAEGRERGDEAGLDEVLDHIDLRAAVELAKAEMRAAA